MMKFIKSPYFRKDRKYTKTMVKEKINQQKIIETAEALIIKLNSSEVTISQIASELGVTHAAIYKHFGNKQELWEAVTKTWFQANIVNKIELGSNSESQIEQLHNLLWSFVEAKRMTYNHNHQMFILNTQYVDNNPHALRETLIPLYQKVNELMGWSDADFTHAETIISAFAVFTLPSFKETWNDPDFETRFEDMWNLIMPGLGSN